jgi:putative phosphoesterase
MFTLGLIADIHGDLTTLQTVLDLLHSQQVDMILCAGDLVEKGEHGDAVVQTIREQSIPCVLGNHDEAALSNQQWLRENADLNHPNMRGRLLKETTLHYLANLPRTLRFSYEGQRLLLVHGTPQSNVAYLLPQTPPQKYQEIARQAEADAIIFGHTHTPLHAKFESVWFFNPGSVCAGGKFESHTCATLRLPDYAFNLFDLNTGKRINVPFLSE